MALQGLVLKASGSVGTLGIVSRVPYWWLDYTQQVASIVDNCWSVTAYYVNCCHSTWDVVWYKVLVLV